MKDIAEKINGISDRANQIASLACAVSDAATYSPDDIAEYKGALVLLANLTRELADGLNTVVNG